MAVDVHGSACHRQAAIDTRQSIPYSRILAVRILNGT
jgi:hypothetical protein